MYNHVFIINGLVYDLDSVDEWIMTPKMSYHSNAFPVILFPINYNDPNDTIPSFRHLLHFEAKDKPDLIEQLKRRYPNIQFVKKTKLVKLIYNIP